MKLWIEIKDELMVDGKLNLDLVRERWGDLEGVCNTILDQTGEVEREERAWLLTNLFQGSIDVVIDLTRRVEALEAKQMKSVLSTTINGETK